MGFIAPVGVDSTVDPIDTERRTLDRDVLTAYRTGTLGSHEEAGVEWSLAGSRTGRARLAELAGIRLDVPARRSAARRRVLVATLAAAASIAFVALLVLDRGKPDSPTPRPLPEFEIRAEGLAEVRGEPGGARALPDGNVRVVVEPRTDAIPGLHFGAYRLDGSGLTRLAEPAEVAVEVDRGSAILTAPAARLVGSAVGTRPFFVVVTDRPGLPGHIRVGTAGPETALGQASSGRVYRVLLTIIDATDGAP